MQLLLHRACRLATMQYCYCWDTLRSNDTGDPFPQWIYASLAS